MCTYVARPAVGGWGRHMTNAQRLRGRQRNSAAATPAAAPGGSPLASGRRCVVSQAPSQPCRVAALACSVQHPSLGLPHLRTPAATGLSQPHSAHFARLRVASPAPSLCTALPTPPSGRGAALLLGRAATGALASASALGFVAGHSAGGRPTKHSGRARAGGCCCPDPSTACCSQSAADCASRWRLDPPPPRGG